MRFSLIFQVKSSPCTYICNHFSSIRTFVFSSPVPTVSALIRHFIPFFFLSVCSCNYTSQMRSPFLSFFGEVGCRLLLKVDSLKGPTSFDLSLSTCTVSISLLQVASNIFRKKAKLLFLFLFRSVMHFNLIY